MRSAEDGFFAIVLAAGASRRMGRDKAGLPWLDGKSLLEWTTIELQRAGWHPVTVLNAHNHATWRDRLPSAALVLNPAAATGKTTSLAAAARALPPDVRRVLVTSIDQPRRPALYRAMRETAAERRESVLVPDRNGRRGHPVVLAGNLRAAMMALPEDSLGLRGLLDANVESTYRVPGDPDERHWDFNTPETYREALAWFEAQPR